MKKPKEVTISIDDQFFTIELAVDDEELIEIFFNGLKKYAGQGSPIKLTQAYVDSDALSKGTKIVTKTITQGKQIDALRMEVRRITTVLLRR
jgi:hypothetical protein